MKKILLFILLLLIGIWGYKKLNANFSPENITLKTWPKVENPPVNDPKYLKILDQSFRYLGKGRQSFVFESEDKKYVLKFIKCQRINVTDFYKEIPLPRFLDKKRKANLYERQDRVERLFTSMQLAYNPLKELTGTLFLHVTQQPIEPVELIDKLGFTHTVDLTHVPFALQIKAEKIMPTLKDLYKKGDLKGLEIRLNQIIDLFVKRANLGILDKDSSLLLHDNIGFTETRAIYIDIGTFKRSKKATTKKALKRDFKTLKPIERWLRAKNPTLALSFSQKIKEAIEKGH